MKWFCTPTPPKNTKKMPHETEHGERASGIAESRLHARLPVHSLAYVELTEENAGLILNISETGMAVQAVQLLTASEFSRMRFRLPGTEIPVEAAGKLVWQIRSKKEAGIEFVDLTEKARAQIRDWIADEPKRAAAAIARTQRKESPAPELAPRTEGDEQASSPRTQTQRPTPATSALPSDASGATRQRVEPVSPSLLRLALEAEYRKAQRGRNAGAAPAAAPTVPAASTPGIERRLFRSGDSSVAEQVEHVERPFQGSATSAKASEHVPTSKPPLGSGNGGHESWDDGHSREWPPLQLHGPRILQSEAVAEVNSHFPRWNSNLSADAGLDYQRPRRSRTYVVLIGLLIALGLWAFVLLNPGAVPRARFEELAERIESVAGKSQPPQSEPAQNSTQPTATSRDTNSNGAQAANQNPHANDAQTSRGGDQSTVSDSKDSKAGDQPQLPLVPGSGVTANQLNSAHSTRSGQAPSDTRAAESKRKESPAKEKPAVQAGRQNEGRQSESGNVRRATEQQAVNSPASDYGATQSPIYQSPVDQSATPQRPAESERSATETVPSPSSAPPYSGASGAPTTQQTTQAAPPVQPNQDAYARRSTNSTNSTATASESTPGSGTRSVELPSSQISPVTPSVPLSGVPSGSVGATSRFHAIRGTQLTGSLQIGGLASSYSPTYPIEAARQHIEGTVRLDVVVSKDGTVRSVQVLSGPPMLASASAAAVKDWRYEETFLAGQPVETQQYVTLVFRLAK